MAGRRLHVVLCAMLGGRDIERTKIGSLLSEFTMVTHRALSRYTGDILYAGDRASWVFFFLYYDKIYNTLSL